MPKVGFISGVFDCLHDGHLYLLKTAKAHCDVLFVVINSDYYVQKHKGRNRTQDTAEIRKKKLLDTGMVDYVFVNREESPLYFIEQIKPHFIFVGNDYKEENVVGHIACKSWGGQVLIIPRIAGISTTEILKKKYG